jgi:hypothetical protein
VADFLTTFGIRLFERLDYGTYYGLLLNLGRARMQPAYATMRGVRAAMGKSIPADMFDAIAASEDEAQEMAFEAEAAGARAAARQAAKGML